MYFMDNQNKDKVDLYLSYLTAIASLSRLFSESSTPFLYYRASENIFCRVFGVENLSRSDTAFDAKKDNTGIGIKTFKCEGNSKSEKIAEFDALSSELKKLKDDDLALKLAELRNERIEFANRNFNINNGLYHCIARTIGKLKIFECDYDLIDINSITVKKYDHKSIHFEDGKNYYSFNVSKSTLFKRFTIPEKNISLKVDILENPYDLILNAIKQKDILIAEFKPQYENYVVLPLFSTAKSKDGKKVVAEKSGLNQWNAGGRPRDIGEVYIPVPQFIHKNFPDFFPSRDTPFNLHIPSGEILSAKLCQENSKALMTNPNNALAEWVLRKVLNLKEGELLTYDKFKKIGMDSVKITKLSESDFRIDFAKIGSFERFIKTKI
jgi:hypothetical protein